MVLPIIAYGDPVLRKKAVDIDKDYPGLDKLIEDMFETMEKSKGVGLAAPQINKSIRLFIIDSTKMFDEEDVEKGLCEVFINAEMLDESGTEWKYEEGCLSIPKIREDIHRTWEVRLKYLDENFVAHEGVFHGITARVIQHEYDHIEGKLFIDYLSQLKKRLIKKKLDDITAGKVKTDYRMLFPK